MVAVIAILVTLISAGSSLLNGTGVQSRRAALDQLTALIEQARTVAITSRAYVVLAIAEPGDLPAGDERCRVGLFKVEEWPDSPLPPLALKGVLLNRWQRLNTGIVLLPGAVNGLVNPMDQQEVSIAYGGTQNLSVKVHAIAFNSRGGLHYPAGSTPITLRLAEGAYRSGKACPNPHGEAKTISENRLKIGRITARPYPTGE